MVIIVECREEDGSDVIAFVGSSWNIVDTFVANPNNFGYSRQKYIWWAQENFVDNDDAVYNCGRTRTYDERGVLLEDDTPSPERRASWKDALEP